MNGSKRQCIGRMDLPKIVLVNLELCSELIMSIFTGLKQNLFKWDAVVIENGYPSDILTIEEHLEEQTKTNIEHVWGTDYSDAMIS